MLAENIVLYLQNTLFVLLFNILCIEFHETFCEVSLNYSQHAGCKKVWYCLLWKGEKSHWCKDWGWCKDRSMTVADVTFRLFLLLIQLWNRLGNRLASFFRLLSYVPPFFSISGWISWRKLKCSFPDGGTMMFQSTSAEGMWFMGFCLNLPKK